MTDNDATDLGHLFATVVHDRPDALAVISLVRRVTNAELLRDVAVTADVLRANGVAPGHRVAIMLANGAAFVTAVFAVWGAGAVVVPLDPKLTTGELERILADTNVRVLLADQRFEPTVSKLEAIPLWADNDAFASVPNAAGSCSDHFRYAPDQPAVIQYSSGSIGRSKRVTRTHRQLRFEAASVASALALSSKDRVLAVVPIHHSFGFGNAMLAPLGAGATLVTLEQFFPRDVIRILGRERITVLPAVPFMYKLLASVLESPEPLALRLCYSAGASLPLSTFEAFRTRFGIDVRQLYGTTETGAIAVNVAEDTTLDPQSVGRPLPNVCVDIVDEEGHSLPVGAEGMVAVKSGGATSCYDGSVTATDSVFRGDWFVPGDLGVLSSEGLLTLRGRTRLFINVAGNKVDPGEVEGVLRQHPLVTDAAVLGIDDGSGQERVKAVIVVTGPCDREQLFEHCRQRLSEHKRPRIIAFRDEIPRSALGKLLRKYLIEE